jgi:hypothetical protein
MKYSICNQYKTCQAPHCTRKYLWEIHGEWDKDNIIFWNERETCNAGIKRKHIIFVSKFQYEMWKALRKNK